MRALRNTDLTAATAAATPTAAPLPTHGGLYEADPDTRALRAVEGGPPEDKPAPPTDATTGDQP